MANPYIGEIRMFAGNFAPTGWNVCDGSVLPIDLYDTLFNLIGTTYGGDGVQNFALPDLRGRLPVHVGQGYVLGQPGGVETVTLTINQMPVHNHTMFAANGGTAAASPIGGTAMLAAGGVAMYTPAINAIAPMNPAIISYGGDSQPHDNVQPYQCINFIISLSGIVPSQT